MKVLLTGSTGLVGRAIATRLSAEHSVVGLARGGAVDTATVDHLRVDLGSEEAASSILEADRCDAIVHAAASRSSDPLDPEMVRANCGGTLAALSVAAQWRVRRFVYVSGVSVIGAPLDLPVRETHRAEPRTPYLAAKLFGEHLVEAAAAADGLRASVLRLSAPVGPGMPGDRILPVFVARAIREETIEVAGEGTRSQDYVDVRDVAEAVAAAIDAEADGCFNVARGAPISNLELARLCVEVLGSASEVRTGSGADPQEGDRWEISIEKASNAWGYAPRRSLPETIEAVARLG